MFGGLIPINCRKHREARFYSCSVCRQDRDNSFRTGTQQNVRREVKLRRSCESQDEFGRSRALLRAFLAAMVPFVAPNELKGVCTGFGLDYDSIVLLRNEQTSRQASRMNRGESASGNVNAGGMNGFMNPFGSAGGAVNGNMGSMNSGAAMNGMNSFGGMNPFGAAGGQQMQLIQMLMGMQNIMKSGKGDISRIMNMMGGR